VSRSVDWDFLVGVLAIWAACALGLGVWLLIALALEAALGLSWKWALGAATLVVIAPFLVWMFTKPKRT
jgi:hypothetical protein